MVNDISSKINNVEFNQLTESWRRYFNQYCIYNDDVADLTWLQIAGAMAKNARLQYAGDNISLRVNSCIIQPPSSGKGQSNKPVKEICSKVSLSFVQYTETTDAGLVGTVLPPRRQGQAPAVVAGALASSDFLVFTEGECILRSGADFNRNMHQILQNATDDPGLVGKRMAHGEINYITNTAVMITSYFVPDFNYALLNKGLLQRVFLVYKDFTTKQIKGIQDFLTNSTVVGVNNEPVPDELIQFFLNLSTKKVTLKCDDKAAEAFKILFAEFGDKKRSFVSEGGIDLLNSFLTRFHKTVFKIAGILALTSNRETILLEDLTDALKFGEMHVDSAIRLINGAKDPEFELTEKAIVSFLKKQHGGAYCEGKVKFAVAIHDGDLPTMGVQKLYGYIDRAEAKGTIVCEKDLVAPNKFVYRLPGGDTAKT
ncbi:MAG: hypothetical protein NTY48_04415 [Candidatus Diapherotrites archaeon]|nr:hypothetical protein [Candidatus Diapherotrites archaeon]